jgi:replication factor A1
VLAIKSAKLGDFGGRSLGTLNSSTIEVNPDIEDTRKIQSWWTSTGSMGHIRSVTERGGPGGGEGNVGPILTPELRKCVSDLKDGAMSGPDNLMIVKATIMNIRHDDLSKISYPACPGMVDGRLCNKKLVDHGGSSWGCERCGTQTPHYRYILSGQIVDYSGSEYVTLFDAEAQAFLGVDANSIQVSLATSSFSELLWLASFLLPCVQNMVEQYGGSGAPIPSIAQMFSSVAYKEVLLSTKAKVS